VDDYDEELDRWVRRAKLQRRRLRTGSDEERHLSRAIRGMEIAQLGRRIRRAQTELGSLRTGSDEQRELAQALQEMGDEYEDGRRELNERTEYPSPARSDAGGRIAQARRALERASSGLGGGASGAALREAITQTRCALELLQRELQGRAASAARYSRNPTASRASPGDP
jgi:hypothetical protein